MHTDTQEHIKAPTEPSPAQGQTSVPVQPHAVRHASAKLALKCLRRLSLVWGLVVAGHFGLVWHLPGAQLVGKRPYELDWAGRTHDHCPPLVDFEDLTGWRVETRDAVASFERSREQQIWGDYVGKLTYRGTGAAPEVRVLPPQPIPIPHSFDALSLWCYGNNWGYAPDPNTPPVLITALFADAAGQELRVPIFQVNWTEWHLMHRRLSPDQIQRVKAGARFTGLLVTGGRNKQDRALYFDNFAVFTEQFPPLQFEPRPQRGIAMLPGQSPGLNTGPGRLPFPTREQTILPDNLVKDFQTTIQPDGAAFVFTYTGSDGTLVYRLEPKTGTWTDVEVRWQPADGRNAPALFRPCVDGGVYLQTAAGPKPPETAEHLGTVLRAATSPHREQRNADTPAVESRWRLRAGTNVAEVTYVYRLWNKSLVMDVLAPDGQVAEVRFGRAVGLNNPRLVTNPFYPARGGRPAVVVSGPVESPLFVTGHVDWYLSNGSVLWAANSVSTNGVVYHGGTRYQPLTDGRRNDCFERFFLTVSPRYEETLPVVPNPVSPWKHITGTRLWRAHGASNRKADAAFWTECHRWGMTQVIVTDHETMWRDGGESFTFRTRAAPGKGGDPAQYEYARLMQDQLGFVYGPYNNFTDFAPVNEFWHFDLVSRTPDNQLQHAWMRCYAPKPARAVEFCARLAPEIQRKFKFSTAYCDVHTAVAPWDRVDYDPRVPGAGTFAAVFYAYGEIMLLQKAAWNGPVYSEGNYHAFYCGLTDGNYGQDQSYRPAENPWLVDFDLRQLHDLCCNFGMGNPDMFYAGAPMPRGKGPELDAWLDRFLAATVAFGHPGFLTYEGGLQNALRSYYMLQQLHSRYCLTNVADIRYVDAQGRLLDTTAAVATGAYQRSQVVTRYADGTVTAANGSRTDRLVAEAWGRKLDLPPNGYAGWTADGAIEVLASDLDGHRCDYAVTPAYLYVDGRGRFVRFPKAAGNGSGICRILTNGQYEVLLHGGAECGFAVEAASAVALDKDRKELGPAQVRRARGLTYVVPVQGAFSYLLKAPSTAHLRGEAADQAFARLAPTLSPTGGEGRGEGAASRGQKRAEGRGEAPVLRCDRDEVFPGERVVVQGRQQHEIQIPADAQPGQRLWIEREGAWIDFTVVPLADTQVALQGHSLEVRLRSRAPKPEMFTITADGCQQSARLEPRQPTTINLNLGPPQQEDARPLTITIAAAGHTQRLERGLRIVRELAPLAELPGRWTKGMRLRGQPETSDFGATGTIVDARETACGGVARKSLFMHPPWMGGVGCCWARFEPVALPKQPAAAFRAWVGKADGSDLGDGILYQLAVVDERSAETVAATLPVTNHAWVLFEADLSPWAGQRVALKLVTDVGTNNNSSGDWGCWADLRIETLQPQLRYLLEDNPDLCRHEPGPYPVAGLTLEMLRAARAGWLRYDGRGLEGPGRYATYGVLNGVALGEMKPAYAAEQKGAFQRNVGLPLAPEALRTLGRRNRFVLQNPNRDYFAVGRFWIELDLADGRKCSSDVSTAIFTQPPEWPSAEGICLPFGQDIAVDMWFPIVR